MKIQNLPLAGIKHLITLLCFLPALAMAVPVQWTVNNVHSVSGILTGSFIYDADTQQYSSVNLTTSGYGDANDASYPYPCNSLSICTHYSPSALEAYNSTAASPLTGKRFVRLLFQSPLTNAGGTISLVAGGGLPNSAQHGICNDASCVLMNGYSLNSGTVTGVPISAPVVTGTNPVPTLSWPAMLALAAMLGGFAYTRRKQR